MTAPATPHDNPRSMRAELVRYGFSGIATNLLAYGAYIALTAQGMTPRLSMTLVYAAALAVSFSVNRRWTFQRGDRHSPWRFLGAHVIGYGVNYLMLSTLPALGIPHEAVQAAAIFVVAGILFVLHRHWVFHVKPGDLT